MQSHSSSLQARTEIAIQEKAEKELNALSLKDKLKFPADAFPKKIQDLVADLSERLNYPSENTFCSLLFASSVAIGNSCRLKFLWEEGANLFLVIVGNPGTNKSHPVKFALEPILKRDRTSFLTYEKEREKHDEAISKSHPGNRKYLSSRPPVLKKALSSDSSMEGIKASMINNERGIGLWVDELAGWLNTFKSYNSAQEQWLSIWSRQEIIHDRKNQRPVRIPYPYASVIGTIQTEIMNDMAKSNLLANGFSDRLLFVKLSNTERNRWKSDTKSTKPANEWNEIAAKLLDIPLEKNESGNLKFKYLEFTPDAEDIILKWQNDSIGDDKEKYGEIIQGIAAKNEVYVLRFALILQLLSWACGEGGNEKIEKQSAENAIALSGYFKKTALQIFEHVSKQNPLDRLTDLKDAVYQALPNDFLTGDGVKIASKYQMPERTFKHWLASDNKVFNRTGHGRYGKIYRNN